MHTLPDMNIPSPARSVASFIKGDDGINRFVFAHGEAFEAWDFKASQDGPSYTKGVSHQTMGEALADIMGRHGGGQ